MRIHVISAILGLMLVQEPVLGSLQEEPAPKSRKHHRKESSLSPEQQAETTHMVRLHKLTTQLDLAVSSRVLSEHVMRLGRGELAAQPEKEEDVKVPSLLAQITSLSSQLQEARNVQQLMQAKETLSAELQKIQATLASLPKSTEEQSQTTQQVEEGIEKKA